MSVDYDERRRHLTHPASFGNISDTFILFTATQLYTGVPIALLNTGT